MENHKEDILKKFLQDTFSDYEPEPSDASWEKIFSVIQPNQPTFWDKSKPWIASGLVLIISTLLWYSSSDVTANNSEIALNTERIEKPIETLKVKKRIQKDPKPTQSDDSHTNSKLTQSDDSQTDSEISQTAKNQHTISLKNIQKISIPSQIKETIVNNNTPKEEEVKHPKVEQPSDVEVANNLTASLSNVERQSLIVRESSVKTQTTAQTTTAESSVKTQTTAQTTTAAKLVDNYANVVGEDTNHGADNLTASTSGRVETLATGETTVKQTFTTDEKSTSIIEQVRYIRPMESLKNKDFTLSKIAINPVLITPIINLNREAKPVRQHTYLSMSITPIQTYRILTINNKNVQNVLTNKLFDSERNGWQFDLGITKPMGNLWNFRANVSYLRMRQWSEYQVSTDELVLRNTNNGYANQNASNTLEVVGQTVTESKNLQMVGLKMDVQRFFKITGKNRYFISTGTQMMYENSQKQGNIFWNVSAGFQHVINPNTFLTIEPIASYSLNNFNDSKSLLQANGYNLGLKMGVSFKVK